jgi:hypothetical protein
VALCRAQSQDSGGYIVSRGVAKQVSRGGGKRQVVSVGPVGGSGGKETGASEASCWMRAKMERQCLASFDVRDADYYGVAPRHTAGLPQIPRCELVG